MPGYQGKITPLTVDHIFRADAHPPLKTDEAALPSVASSVKPIIITFLYLQFLASCIGKTLLHPVWFDVDFDF